jgi:hypothetical protein
MSATIKFSKTIKAPCGVPTIPDSGRRARRDEMKEVETFIRAVGGKPMTPATKKRLAQAGCAGLPKD